MNKIYFSCQVYSQGIVNYQLKKEPNGSSSKINQKDFGKLERSIRLEGVYVQLAKESNVRVCVFESAYLWCLAHCEY